MPLQPTAPASTFARAATGDRPSLDLLARRLQPVLRRMARRALSRAPRAALDLDDAVEEVVAEVQAFLATGMLREGPGWRRFEVERCGGAVEAWLFGIVRNKVRRRMRDARRRAEAEPPFGSAPPPAIAELAVERALDGERALRLLSRLPLRERAALRLWLEDTSSREIARRLHFSSHHAVDCLLSRGKQRLRRMLLGAGGELEAA